MGARDQEVYVDAKVTEYKRLELLRRSVKDVKLRAQEQEKKRKMQGKAYEGVKSKLARNLKVIDHVNKTDFGYVPPHKRPMSAQKRKNFTPLR